jgi:elongator complex protein 3
MDQKTAEISSQADYNYTLACKSVAEQIQEQEDLSAKAISKIVKDIASKYHLSTLPKNESIIEYLPDDSHYKKVLMVRPTKTASGIAVITVMPKPFECPQGRCIYCPGGIEFNTPLSYIGTEPSARSAQKSSYDPYRQVQSMLFQLRARGHDTGKVELVIVGGTFPFMPIQYQKDFSKSCFDALNEIKPSASLQEAIINNETAKNRCVGFTIETKPDYCKQKQIDIMLELGATRIEIGVQSLRDEVYKAVNRGHTLKDVVESFQIARDAGYKIVAHMMPGLPNSSPEKDIEDFQTLFQDSKFKPDMLKIYPTLVVKHTGLYKLYMQGKYHPYSDSDLMDVLFEVKKAVPSWVRIMRIRCNCIRCREAGLQRRYLSDKEIKMNRIDYLASNGLEVFLSIESVDKLTILGFLRLRKIMGNCRKELKDYGSGSSCAAIVRELHVYGQMLNVGKAGDKESSQHKGYGLRLMQEAEKITKEEFGVHKLSVISAVGTREYYKKLGYIKNGPYVSKLL